MGYDDGFLLGHSGSGGMTSSLATGIHGSANERRLAQFPLSPILNTGRSLLTTAVQVPLFDPRDSSIETTPQAIAAMIKQQWKSRSRPVHTREEISFFLRNQPK